MEKVIHRSNKSDLFKNHDYFGIDDLLTEEHKMIRDSVRTWVSKEVLPIIESCAEQNECPLHLYKQM